MACDNCEWYRYQMPTDNSLKNKRIPTIITDLRRCERGFCDRIEKEEGEDCKWQSALKSVQSH